VVAYWNNATLSRSWNKWREAIIGWSEEEQKMAKALVWWSNRCEQLLECVKACHYSMAAV
jgi:hypothetical protein